MQQGSVLLLALALGCAHATTDVKNRPVSKVVTLLKDMITQLEKEAEQDEEVYEAIGCWCETNDREKTKSIADGTQRVADLTAAIEEYTSKSAELNTQTKNLEAEVAKNERALDQATALRKKQLAEFNSEEKNMLQSISALKSAVVVIGKQNSAMLQDSDAAINIAVMLHSEIKKHRAVIGDSFTPEQMQLIKSFSTSPEGFLQTNAPASGEIFGILKQMKETFETNLGSSQREETTNQKAFEDLKAAKEEEISAGQSLLDTKTNELATADEKAAVSKEDLDDTQKTLAADQSFLASVKENCADLDQQYEERTKTRQLEIQATSKALAFLSSDEAHDLFSRTFNMAAFVQVSSHRYNAKRDTLYQNLLGSAERLSDPRLATLAESAKLDAFAKVKKSIQDMVQTLVKEKEDEIKHKDFCVEELNNNEREIEGKERDKSDFQAKMDDLTMTIDQLSKAMEMLKAEIAEMQVQMKRAGEDREKENKNFQMEISDQRATQKLLAAALGVLKGFYDKAALVQTSKQPEGNAPPQFKKMEKNAASGGVMGMIQNIINDSKAAEAEAIRGEETAQKAYETFVKETNMSVEEKSKDLVSKSEEKGKTEVALVETKKELEGVMGEIEQLYNENADLHKSCDFIMKNFEVRQTSRDEEIEALKQSIAMFSGASFQ